MSMVFDIDSYIYVVLEVNVWAFWERAGAGDCEWWQV